MAFESRSLVEPVAEELGKQVGIFREATMQLRMSPGGSVEFFTRRPLTPSSLTVTTALIADKRVGWLKRFSSCGTKPFNPRRRGDRPVPPPIATTRSGCP